MIKKIITLSMLAVLLGVPSATFAQTDKTGIEAGLGAISISVNETTLHIQNAEGEMLYIYNLAGMKMAAYRIDSPDVTLNLSVSKGCYILKVGKCVRKVSIR